jgi:acyl carrier protein
VATHAQANQEELERQLIEAIRSCLEAGGREVPDMTADTIPLKDLKDFDSLCAIEVLVDLEGKLEKELGEDLFLQGKGTKAKPRTVREVAHAILHETKAKKKGGSKQNA